MTRRTLSTGLAGLAGFAALVAVTAEAAPTPPKSCFWIRSVDSFRSVENRTVYVRANMHDVYELKLFAPCLDVDWTHNIGLRSRGSSSVCEGTGNAVEIVVRSTAHHQRCQVSNIRKLTSDEVAALPPAARP